MLTKVRLDGVMGKKFGKEWELDVSSPAEALRLIDANSPGLKRWVIQNSDKYNAYKVVCVYDTGVEEALSDETFPVQRTNIVSIRFTPTVAGAGGGIGKILVGALIMFAAPYAAGWLFANTTMVGLAVGVATYGTAVGAALALSGVIEILSPRPKAATASGDESKSYYFDGAVNTERQGSPVPLIYGRVLVGSHPISASISVDEIAP